MLSPGYQHPRAQEKRREGEKEKGMYKCGLESVHDQSLTTQKGTATGEGRVDLEKKKIKHEITNLIQSFHFCLQTQRTGSRNLDEYLHTQNGNGVIHHGWKASVEGGDIRTQERKAMAHVTIAKVTSNQTKSQTG